MYSQNGELIYPSDSEDSVAPTNNADNRAVTPHSNQSLSPTPAKQSSGSPPCAKTDSFSPRYSPPNISNHLENAAATPAVSQHDSLTTAALTSAATIPTVPNHIDSLSNLPSQADNRSSHQDLSRPSQSAHINTLTTQNSLGANLHQVYKTSPQASPTAVGAYNMPYQLSSQYGHSVPILNQSQSRYCT